MEAKKRFSDLVIASLGAQRKEKPGGVVTARVLFDGTHGLCVNSRTRLRTGAGCGGLETCNEGESQAG